jgi:hypothetical protein
MINAALQNKTHTVSGPGIEGALYDIAIGRSHNSPKQAAGGTGNDRSRCLAVVKSPNLSKDCFPPSFFEGISCSNSWQTLAKLFLELNH